MVLCLALEQFDVSNIERVIEYLKGIVQNARQNLQWDKQRASTDGHIFKKSVCGGEKIKTFFL